MAETKPTSEKQKKQLERLAAFMPIITVALGLAYLVAGYLLVLLPQLQKVTSGIQGEIDALRVGIEADTAYSASLEERVAEFRQMNSEKKAMVGHAVPLEPQVPDLFVQYDAIARKNGLVMESIDAQEDPASITPEGIVTVRISMNLTGAPYANFKAYLNDVEHNERLADVQSVLFVPDSGTYGVILHTYYLDLTPPKPTEKKK